MRGKESTMTVNPSRFQAWTFGQATLFGPRTQFAQALVAWWHGFAPKADGIMLGFQEGSKMNYTYLRNTNCISLCLHHKLLLGEVDLKPLPCWQLHESRPYLDKDGLLDLELHAVKWSLNDNRPFCKTYDNLTGFPVQHSATCCNFQQWNWCLRLAKRIKNAWYTVWHGGPIFISAKLLPLESELSPHLCSLSVESRNYTWKRAAGILDTKLCRNLEFRRKCINNSYHWSYTKTGSLPGFWANYGLSPNTAGAREHCIKTKSPSHSVALPHSGSPANHGGIACIVAWQVYVYTNILDDRTSYCPEHVSHWHNHLHRTGSSLSN